MAATAAPPCYRALLGDEGPDGRSGRQGVTTAYVESSALVKLVVDEPESSALRSALEHATRTTSELAITEVVRGARRRHGDTGSARARAAILSFELMSVDRPVLDAAARLDPPNLRSLDAIHVATALTLGSADVVFFSYDRRTIEAAEAHGLTVSSPGA
ncbi:MAG: PIN domain-containing protein [Acidimicrobiia bacterium]|nr:PIN domain-containing protein [Acidimicrobiia bacterium]